MSDGEKHSIRNNIIATVIGGLILLGLTYVSQNFYVQLFAFLQNGYEKIRLYFSASTSIPNSILWLLILIVVGITTYFIKNKKSVAKPNHDLEVQQLQQEITTLRTQIKPELSNLAGLDEKIKVSATYYDGSYKRNKTTSLTWKEIFSLISPFLLDSPNDTKMKNSLMPPAIFGSYYRLSINDQDYETIKIHLMAIKLISVDYSKTTDGGMALFWNLTTQGRKLLMELRSVKRSVE